MHTRPAGTLRVKLGAIGLRVPIRSEYFLHYYHRGEYEPETVQLFRNYLRAGDGVVDVGSNAGLFTLLSASLVGPTGWVVAVEPDPRSIELLSANVRARRLTNVTVWPVALGEAQGRGALHQAADSMYSTMVSGDEDVVAAGTVAVECRSFADVCGARPAGAIRMVKIDAEGSELGILRGARQYLQGVRDDCLIVCEFNPGFSGGDGRGLRELAAELEAGGFRLLRIGAGSTALLPMTVAEVTESMNVVACRDPDAANRALRQGGVARRQAGIARRAS